MPIEWPFSDARILTCYHASYPNYADRMRVIAHDARISLKQLDQQV